MDAEAIIEQLATYDGTLPYEALNQAIMNHMEVTPYLIDVVRDMRDWADEILADANYTLHIYAPYLLAQFRKAEAYPVLADLFSLPGTALEEMYGNVITEDFGRILASVCYSDTQWIKWLIENPEVNVWVRCASIDAIMTLLATHTLSRDDVFEYFRELYRGRLERENSAVWGWLAYRTCQLQPDDLLQELDMALEDGLIDPEYATIDSVLEFAEMSEKKLLQQVRDDPAFTFITDTIEEIRDWPMFVEE